jgi:hypothetical protein
MNLVLFETIPISAQYAQSEKSKALKNLVRDITSRLIGLIGRDESRLIPELVTSAKPPPKDNRPNLKL